MTSTVCQESSTATVILPITNVISAKKSTKYSSTEKLCHSICSQLLCSHCICSCRPYQSGEVIVQNYNSLLTLAHLAEVSDGIMLVENSALHTACQRLLNIQRPSFTVGLNVYCICMLCTQPRGMRCCMLAVVPAAYPSGSAVCSRCSVLNMMSVYAKAQQGTVLCSQLQNMSRLC